MITLIAHFVIFSSKKINRLKTIFVFFFLFWAAFCAVLTAQKPVSGSNLFSVTALLKAGFSASAPKLPHIWKQTEKRISAFARAAVEKRTSVYAFQRRVSALPKHRHCMEPAASVPLLSSVPPCTRRCSAKDGSGSQQNRVCSGKLEVKKCTRMYIS